MSLNEDVCCTVQGYKNIVKYPTNTSDSFGTYKWNSTAASLIRLTRDHAYSTSLVHECTAKHYTP